MARYGMGEGCVSVSLSDRLGSKVEIDALVPYESIVYSVAESENVVFRIKEIRGIFSYYQDDDAKCVGIYPQDTYEVYPGDQYVGIRIILDKIDDHNISKDEFSKETNTECLIIQISDDSDCCEVWGAMLSEDDLSRFLGSRLLKVYFTDTSLNTEYLQTISKYKDPLDYHNVQFINIETDKGTFQFTVYNCHNGYYGHDVTITFENYDANYFGVI